MSKNLRNFFLENSKSPIRTGWKIYSCSFYQFCIVVTIFRVTTLLSILSTTQPFLAENRRPMKSNYIFTYVNWNINLTIGFVNPCVLYFGSFYNSYAIIWNRFSFIFSLVFLSFHTSVNTFPKLLSKYPVHFK